MRSSRWLAVAVAGALVAAAANAAHLDFNDPKRAVGREDDVRVDAQLNDDVLSSHAPVPITYQIDNLRKAPVAIADQISSADYDPETQTITISVGAEVPSGNTMPHLVAIGPGEKRVFTASALLHVAVPAVRTPWTAVPRYVEIKVVLLRDVAPFAHVLEQQSASAAPQPFSDTMFDRWIEASSSVRLNAIPIRWTQSHPTMSAESDR